MQILKTAATKNASRKLALNRQKYQSNAANIIPAKAEMKGTIKCCIGMLNRYFSITRLGKIASNSPIRPLAAIQTISIPLVAQMNASTKDKARNILDMVVFRESPLARDIVVGAVRSMRILCIIPNNISNGPAAIYCLP